jgi:hypothetical protein
MQFLLISGRNLVIRQFLVEIHKRQKPPVSRSRRGRFFRVMGVNSQLPGNEGL